MVAVEQRGRLRVAAMRGPHGRKYHISGGMELRGRQRRRTVLGNDMVVAEPVLHLEVELARVREPRQRVFERRLVDEVERADEPEQADENE